VLRVLDGEFPCDDADVRYDDTADVDPQLSAGDIVLVSGDPLSGVGPCALMVSQPGTFIRRSPGSQVFLPFLEQ
jgi:hypothetical protein